MREVFQPSGIAVESSASLSIDRESGRRGLSQMSSTNHGGVRRIVRSASSMRRVGLRSALIAAMTAAMATPIVIGSVASAGSLSAHSVTNPTFVLLQTNGTQSYFVDEASGATAEAATLGATVTVENESDSDATTVSDLQAAIAAGDNGALVVAPDETTGARLVSLANTANMPIISVDNGFSGGSDNLAVPAVGFNAAVAGQQSGKLLASYYKKSGFKAASTYAAINVIPTLATCQTRTNAEIKDLKAAGLPASHILSITYDGTSETALNNMAPVQTAHPQAKDWLLTGCNDDGVYGDAKALTSHGVSEKNIIGVGLGADLACTMWAAGAPNLGIVASDYVNPADIGKAGVLEMYNFVVKGTPFPLNNLIASVPVTRADYKKYVSC